MQVVKEYDTFFAVSKNWPMNNVIQCYLTQAPIFPFKRNFQTDLISFLKYVRKCGYVWTIDSKSDLKRAL